MQNNPILSLNKISYSVHEETLLKEVNLKVSEGEIHALVGEPGSGKTLIVKLLGGALRHFSGTISVFQKEYNSFSMKQSIKAGVAVVHKSLSLIPTFSALENIYIGKYHKSLLNIIKFNHMKKELEKYLLDHEIELDIKSPVENLSFKEQNRVKLIKALYFHPKIAIFEEGFKQFNQDEIDLAYSVIQSIVQSGGGVLYIASNINEIFEFADRVSIIRDGKIINTEPISQVDKIRLIDLTYSFASTREELRQTNEELYKYKKYNEDVLKNIPAGVIILDNYQNPYLINNAAQNIFSLSGTGKPGSIQNIFSGLDETLIDNIIETTKAKLSMTWKEVCLGEDTYLKITVFPFRDENYRFIGTILLIEDISIDYFLNNYMLQTERVSSIAELAAGVAHEINNPLSIILNYIELLSMKNLNEDSDTKLNKIRSEINRMQSIISTLLHFSQPNQELYEELDLYSLIYDSMLLLSHKIKKKAAKIDIKKPGNPIIINANENQMKQVFINLMMNSLEAIDNFGSINIQLEKSDNNDYAEILLTDNGPGIPEDVVEKVFNPFFTTKQQKSNAGLGLSICRHIIESHQGFIECVSETDTAFRIILPLNKQTTSLNF